MEKKLIRSSVFETNSSSSHSISIADDTKEFVLETIYPDQDGKVVLTGGEFGWDWFKNNDSLTKANYAAVDFKYSEELTEMLVDVIKEQTGAEEVIMSFTDDYDGPNHSYIDHDSHGTTPKCKDELRNFIFNQNSWLFGGNDNSTANPTFYDVPEIKDGRKILTVYTHELSIEGFHKKTQFKSKPTNDEIDSALESLMSDVKVDRNGDFDDDNSIMAQIRRNDKNFFSLSTYKKPTDYKKKVVYFVKETWSEARKIWERDFGDNDWSSELGYKKCSEIEKELLNEKDSKFIKGVNFYIKKIK